MLKADKDLRAVVLLELRLFIQLSTMAGVFLLNIEFPTFFLKQEKQRVKGLEIKM